MKSLVVEEESKTSANRKRRREENGFVVDFAEAAQDGGNIAQTVNRLWRARHYV